MSRQRLVVSAFISFEALKMCAPYLTERAFVYYDAEIYIAPVEVRGAGAHLQHLQ